MKKLCYRECNYFFEFISIIALLIAYILFAIQSITNNIFIKSKSKEIAIERLLYQHFSEEIYANIKSYSIQKVITTEENDSNLNNNYINLEVKLDTFFDCQGVKKGLLNEECQDKIINNLTCCRSDCCIKKKDKTICNNYNFDLKQAFFDKTFLTYNDEERIEDPRRRYCKYYNQYSNSTSKLFNNNLQIEYFKYNYEELLLSEDKNKIYIGNQPPEGFIDCGQLDTLSNHLFLKGIPCPINYLMRDQENLYFDSIPSTSLGIFVKNYLSEIPPDMHEWKYIYHYSNEGNKLQDLTPKDINSIIKEDNNNYYNQQQAYFYINELPEFYDKYKDNINEYQKIYWYSTNYIGFKSVEDLKVFKSLFEENNTTENPLYNITQKLFPLVGSAIIGIILAILSLVYFFIYLIYFKINSSINKILLIIKNIIIAITFVVGLILYIIVVKKYKSIDINMDEHYKKIINLYNNRRIQKYLLTGIIIMFLIEIYEIYFIFFAKREMKREFEKGSESTNSIIVYKKDNEREQISNIDNENENENEDNKENNERNREIQAIRVSLHQMGHRNNPSQNLINSNTFRSQDKF